MDIESLIGLILYVSRALNVLALSELICIILFKSVVYISYINIDETVKVSCIV